MAPSSTKAALTESMPGPTLSTIDDVVSYIRSFDVDDTSSVSVRETLLPALNKVSLQGKGKGREIYTSLLQGGIDPLEMLDPATNTLGYAFIMAHRTIACDDRGQAQILMPYVAQFAQSLNSEQLLGAGDIITLLTKGVIHVAEVCQDLVWANPSLLRIFDAFRSVHASINNLTALHSITLYHLLRTAHYDTAFDWIVKYDIVTAETRVTPLVYSDVLEYFYFAGLTLIKVHSYEQACFMLEQCVCSPAQSISAIQMDAYKKLILVQLMRFGKTKPIPNHASPSIQRSIRARVANVEAYHNLSRAFCHEPDLSLSKTVDGHGQGGKGKEPSNTFEQALQSGHETFVRDQNLGLVRQLSSQHLRRRLQRLSMHFSRLSLGDLRTLLGMAGNEQNEFRLILDELIKAQREGWINFKPGSNTGDVLATSIVSFEETTKDLASIRAADALLATVKESQRWSRMVRDKEQTLASSEGYLSKVSELASTCSDHVTDEIPSDEQLLQPGRDRALLSTNDDFDDGE